MWLLQAWDRVQEDEGIWDMNTRVFEGVAMKTDAYMKIA